MANRSSLFYFSTMLLLMAGAVAWPDFGPFVQAQSSKTKSKIKPMSGIEVKQIDVRLEKLQETFAMETAAIIDGYERAGHYERAKHLVEVLLKLDPLNESFRQRLNALDDHLLERTEIEQRFDPASDWTLIGTVFKSRPTRVEASGEFRLNLVVASLGPSGFPSADPQRDLVSSIPTGALMGMIVTENESKERKKQPPFAIQSKLDFVPSDNGELYLKLNLPPGSKCTGDLKLKLCGIARAS